MQKEDKVAQLQMIEQSRTNLLMQRQQFQSQLVEIESAMKELEMTDTVYKIIGNIMVKDAKPKVQSELTSKKDIVELRIKNIEKQEKNLQEKAHKLQQEVVGEEDG